MQQPAGGMGGRAGAGGRTDRWEKIETLECYCTPINSPLLLPRPSRTPQSPPPPQRQLNASPTFERGTVATIASRLRESVSAQIPQAS